MENNISKLYYFYRENSLLISKIREAETLYRKQFYGSGGIKITEISSELSCIEAFPEYIDTAVFQKCVFNIISSLQSEDFVLCADTLNSFIYEVLLPIQQRLFNDLSEYISELYESISQESKGLINLEETPFGYPTLLYKSAKYKYLCSTLDPMEEAYALAKENFAPEADAYHIWGIGLGYHIYALYQLTQGSTDIYVYDNDQALFEMAKEGKLGKWQEVFASPKIHLITDPDVTKFSISLTSEGTKFILHMPSVNKLPEDNPCQFEKKSILKKLQLTINTFEEQKDKIYLNFYKNIKNSDGYAEDLFPIFKDQTVIIVAAGPSLDKNIDILKAALANKFPIKVLCVGTVLKKLLSAGITPDAFFEMDANKITYAQIDGLEDQSIPVILNSTTYFGIANNYQGKKYLACQRGFAPAEKLMHHLFSTGSSVTTLALDFAIQSKASKIILIGCDMAYTGDTSHAEGTVQKHDTTNDTAISVKGYYGETVKSSIQLSMFREWIENRIKEQDAKDVEIINATEGGAYIEGTIHISLKESITR